MKKAFDFVGSLKQPFFDLMGYPTIHVNSDCVDVYFDIINVIRDLSVFDDCASDEFRMFSNDGCITIVFTFYCD